jgi:hypothetical protein
MDSIKLCPKEMIHNKLNKSQSIGNRLEFPQPSARYIGPISAISSIETAPKTSFESIPFECRLISQSKLQDYIDGFSDERWHYQLEMDEQNYVLRVFRGLFGPRWEIYRVIMVPIPVENEIGAKVEDVLVLSSHLKEFGISSALNVLKNIVNLPLK